MSPAAKLEQARPGKPAAPFPVAEAAPAEEDPDPVAEADAALSDVDAEAGAAPDVFPVVLRLALLALFEALSTAPAVIVTLTQTISLPLNVTDVVLLVIAGVFIHSVSVAVSTYSVSYTPVVAAHAAFVVPVILQSISPTRLYMPVADGWKCKVEGPAVRVIGSGKPQSEESVPGTHSMARVLTSLGD